MGDKSSTIDLAEVITADVMAPILTNKDVQQKLLKFLPEGDVLPKTEEELRSTFTTPQYKRVSSRGIILQETSAVFIVYFGNV